MPWYVIVSSEWSRTKLLCVCKYTGQGLNVCHCSNMYDMNISMNKYSIDIFMT